MTPAYRLFHSWLRKWGGDMVTHEDEICKDITDFCAEHVGIAIKEMEELMKLKK